MFTMNFAQSFVLYMKAGLTSIVFYLVGLKEKQAWLHTLQPAVTVMTWLLKIASAAVREIFFCSESES
jgi:hypothetical protein